jgi:hypothetical protein
MTAEPQSIPQSWPAVLRTDGQPVWRSAVLGLDLQVERSLLRFDDPESGPLLVRREVVERWHATQQALAVAERDREQERRAWLAAEDEQARERHAREAAEQRALAAEQALAALQEELRRRGGGTSDGR